MVKKIIGFVLLFSLFPFALGGICFVYKNEFFNGLKIGFIIDLLGIAGYGFIKSIEWAFDTEII